MLSALQSSTSRLFFSISKKGDSTVSLGNVGQCIVTERVFRQDLLYFSVCPLPLVLSLGIDGLVLE